ncbi:MAG: hypothetical protein P8X91_07215, partial [Candidatus Bathyarchaeota archaeon]
GRTEFKWKGRFETVVFHCFPLPHLIFKTEEISKIEITAKNWQQLLEQVEKESSKLKNNIDAHSTSIKNIDEEILNLQNLESMLKIFNFPKKYLKNRQMH